MWIIKASLALTAVYCGGMWLFLAYRGWQLRDTRTQVADGIELVTFHLGLCFILAAGFLGLILE